MTSGDGNRQHFAGRGFRSRGMDARASEWDRLGALIIHRYTQFGPGGRGQGEMKLISPAGLTKDWPPLDQHLPASAISRAFQLQRFDELAGGSLERDAIERL